MMRVTPANICAALDCTVISRFLLEEQRAKILWLSLYYMHTAPRGYYVYNDKTKKGKYLSNNMKRACRKFNKLIEQCIDEKTKI